MTATLSKPVYDYKTSDEILEEVNKIWKAGKKLEDVTTRQFLTWFDAYRRGPNIVARIRSLLEKYSLETYPDFESRYIDANITVRPVKVVNERISDSTKQDGGNDPVFRIGLLASANRDFVHIAPTQLVSQAVTLMIAHDFSQLPVMTGPRDLKGAISWKSIGSRLAVVGDGEIVGDFLEKATVIEYGTPLFSTINTIISCDYVLIQRPDRTFSGIVTTADLSEQFLALGQAFMLVNEIENQVRVILQRWSRLNRKEISKICDIDEDQYEDVYDLTFGNYLSIFHSPDFWKSIPVRIDQKMFCKFLDEVREIRNSVMHFSADPTPVEEIQKLKKFSAFLQHLEAIGKK
ncbi:CBS domain-containing protein [Mesorhizobium sp.]|uniref:CBS domain-containing protein n=1 Tax=Mesorhizobium sp. TaxID=1871066 RepID=UPI0011F497F4|nr:CBS domain-containing protein [Mesorhizobium sp.]TIL35378.1 MAG: hypothetical protein E5Y85_04765 [Mesorhizobium sp.]TIL52973.1 MAG: hypothetical protein E5Y83_10195 [Mesorhizobium sp.]